VLQDRQVPKVLLVSPRRDLLAQQDRQDGLGLPDPLVWLDPLVVSALQARLDPWVKPGLLVLLVKPDLRERSVLLGTLDPRVKQGLPEILELPVRRGLPEILGLRVRRGLPEIPEIPEILGLLAIPVLPATLGPQVTQELLDQQATPVPQGLQDPDPRAILELQVPQEPQGLEQRSRYPSQRAETLPRRPSTMGVLKHLLRLVSALSIAK
ncbi:Hypothetical protein POVN_LOCUS723, partial [uncultured virus]